jgi:hypothetical protein
MSLGNVFHLVDRMWAVAPARSSMAPSDMLSKKKKRFFSFEKVTRMQFT